MQRLFDGFALFKNELLQGVQLALALFGSGVFHLLLVLLLKVEKADNLTDRSVGTELHPARWFGLYGSFHVIEILDYEIKIKRAEAKIQRHVSAPSVPTFIPTQVLEKFKSSR